MYATLARHVVYPLGDVVLRTNVVKYLTSLEKTQWWSPERLRELQNRKLVTLVKHAYQNVPYYHRIFEERGLTYRDIRTIEDLRRLPILTKDDIRHNFPQLMAKGTNRRKPFLNTTGGSTGEPLKYYLDMEVTSITWASAFRSWGWAGYKLGDRRVTIAGSSLVTERPTFKMRARNVLERNLKLSALDMSRETMQHYAGRLNKFKPHYLRGYPSVLFLFADYLNTEGMDIINPKAVFTTAEMLLPIHRETIERKFGCRVFDQYGCYDGGPHACECSHHSGYHISAEKVIMEFVDSNGEPVSPGQSGDIVATDLHNYSMPFIRYAVEDRGSLSKERCPCGRGLPLMKSLEGRTTDVITFSDGSTVPGPVLVDLFQRFQYVRQYQIVQDAVDHLQIRIVRGGSYADKDSVHLLGTLKEHISDKAEIELQFVDQIPRTKAGKWRFIISNLPR